MNLTSFAALYVTLPALALLLAPTLMRIAQRAHGALQALNAWLLSTRLHSASVAAATAWRALPCPALVLSRLGALPCLARAGLQACRAALALQRNRLAVGLWLGSQVGVTIAWQELA